VLEVATKGYRAIIKGDVKRIYRYVQMRYHERG
jgi:hypothetical protein